MDRGSLTLFHVRGVPLRIHWSLLLVLPYLVLVFTLQFNDAARLASVNPNLVLLPPVAWGLIVAVLLFASVAVHELAHALVALRLGGRVRDITLLMLGGISHIERLPRRPRAEALVSFVGPAASLALAALAFALRALVPPSLFDLRLGLFYVFYLNTMLGLFNLLPAFPMDGGRILRALLAARIGPMRATRIAGAVGKIAALVLGFIGVMGGAVLLVLIAIFLYTGAAAETRQVQLREALGGLRVADLMSPAPPLVEPEAAVAELPSLMRRMGTLQLVVLGDAGRPDAVLRAVDLAALPFDAAPTLRVRELPARYLTHAMRVAPDDPVSDALERAGAESAEYLIAVGPDEDRGSAPLGIVGPEELARAVTLQKLTARPRILPAPAAAPWRPSEV